MIERERGQKSRHAHQRETPRDFNVALMDVGWKSKAVIVYGGESEDGGVGPLLLFVEGKQKFHEKDALMALLKVTMNRLDELSKAHMLRCAGTTFRQDKVHGGGTYE